MLSHGDGEHHGVRTRQLGVRVEADQAPPGTGRIQIHLVPHPGQLDGDLSRPGGRSGPVDAEAHHETEQNAHQHRYAQPREPTQHGVGPDVEQRRSHLFSASTPAGDCTQQCGQRVVVRLQVLLQAVTNPVLQS